MHPAADACDAPARDDGAMTITRRPRAAAALPLAALLLVGSLAGCSAVSDALQREAQHEFESREELVETWDKDASWLPVDAETIVTRESTMGDPASLTARSSSALDPERCAEVERRSAPTVAVEDTPDVYKIDQVFACGDWAVVATEDGWFGWTPNHPDERAQSPAP